MNTIATARSASLSLLALACLCGCGDVAAPSQPSRDEAPDVDPPPPAAAPVAGTAQPAAQPPGQATLLRVSSGPPLYLVDASGASVYFVEKQPDSLDCDAVCEDAWPPVVTNQAQAGAGAGVDASAVAFALRPDGSHQATYKGRALYRYAGDSGAGRTSGHGVRDKWGHWRLLTPHGEPLQATPPAAREATPPAPPVPDAGAAADGRR